MNFTFMIDNCLSSCQLAYNGIQLLDYGKQAVDYFVKKRIKGDSKYDTYHLFSCNAALSTWLHDLGHFMMTLKVIQPVISQELLLQDCFHNLNKFRALNGSDNLYGGRDLLKIESSIVFLFTHRDIAYDISQLPLRWDQKLIVFYICPRGVDDVEGPISETAWHSIAPQVGCGQCYTIDSYIGMFELLDELTIVQPQVCFRIHTLSPRLEVKYDELNKYIEKVKIEDQTEYSWLVRSPQKQFSQFASQRFKQQSNMTIFTKVYLPEMYYDLKPRYPLNDPSVYPAYPEYYIDFSQNLQVKMPAHIPYQEAVIESPQILSYIQAIPNKKNQVQFPLLYMEKTHVIIGFLIYSQGTLELRFFFPNFHIFTEIFHFLQVNYSNRNICEQRLQQYLQHIPNYYSPCIKKVLQDNSIQINKQFTYLISEQTQKLYMTKVDALQKQKQKLKKTTDDENYKNRLAHVQKRSSCCAAYSDNYETIFKQQLKCDYRSLTNPRNTYHFKDIYQKDKCSSCLPQQATQPVEKRNAKQDADEIELRWEGAFCGNPWKLYKHYYKDGVEIRVFLSQSEQRPRGPDGGYDLDQSRYCAPIEESQKGLHASDRYQGRQSSSQRRAGYGRSIHQTTVFANLLGICCIEIKIRPRRKSSYCKNSLYETKLGNQIYIFKLMFGQPQQPFQQTTFGQTQPQTLQPPQLFGQQQQQSPFGQQQPMAPFSLTQPQPQQGLQQQGLQLQPQGLQMQQQGMQQQGMQGMQPQGMQQQGMQQQGMQQQGLQGMQPQGIQQQGMQQQGLQQQGLQQQQQGIQPQPQQQGFLTQPQQPQQGLQTRIQQQGQQTGQQQPQQTQQVQGLQQGQQAPGTQPQQSTQALPEITGSRLQQIVQEQADLLKKSQIELDKFNKNYDLMKPIDKNVLMNVMPQNQQLPANIQQTQQSQIKASNDKTFTGKTIQLMKEFQNSQQQAIRKQKEIMEQLDILGKQVEARKSGRIIDEGDVSIPVAFKDLREELVLLQNRISETLQTEAEIHAANEKNWDITISNLSHCFYMMDSEVTKTEDQLLRLEEMLKVQK